jgi:hypothetical protein
MIRISLPWIQTTLLKLISKVQLLTHALDNWIYRWSHSYVIILVHLRVVCYLMIWSYLGMKERTSKGMGKTLEAWRTSEDVRIKMEAQTGSTSFHFRTLRTTHTKTDAHVAYRIGFGCYLYGWKDNFKNLPMELVSGPNSSRVDGNRLHKLTSRICSGAATPSFELLVRVSCQGPFGARPRGLAWP